MAEGWLSVPPPRIAMPTYNNIDTAEFIKSEVLVEPNIDQISPPDQSKPHVLILLHGIRTEALWMNELIEEGIASGKFIAVPVYYGKVSTFKFLYGTISLNMGATIIRDINNIFDEHPDHNVSILCHSFGTKIFCDVAEFIKHKFYIVFFEAGVVRNSTAVKVSQSCVKLLNDCSERDLYPKLATLFNWFRYESSGVYGFRKHWARDRYFPYEHSDYLTKKHFSTYIIPAIISGDAFYLRYRDTLKESLKARFVRKFKSALNFIIGR